MDVGFAPASDLRCAGQRTGEITLPFPALQKLFQALVQPKLDVLLQQSAQLSC